MRTGVLARPRKPYGREPWLFEAFAAAVAQNHSIAGVLRQLGCTFSGSYYRWVHRLVEKYGLDTSHWLGQGYLRDKHHSWSPRRPLSEILVERSTYGNCFQLKRRLIGEGLLKYACDECGISEWRGRPLVLQLDHRNGVGDDHRLENLRLLCPNCHSQTETYCGRNTARAKASRKGAGGGTRTRTGFPPTHFEGVAAACYATPARAVNSTQLLARGAPASQVLQQAAAQGGGGGGAAAQA